jgi:hypothetical protein
VEEASLLLSDSVLSGGKSHLGLVPSLLLAGLGVLLLGVAWVSSDGVVALLVHGLEGVAVDAGLHVLRELLGVGLLVVLLELLHVLGNVATEDVFAVGLGIEVVLFVVVAWESLGGVWDIEATINGTLECAKDLVTGGGSGETGVQEASEWAWTVVAWLHVVLVTIDLLLSLVKLVELHLLEESPGEEETGAVVSGVVLEADRDAELGQLVGVGGADDNITAHSGVDDLADDISVGGSDNKSVFWGVKLVLVLSAEASSGLVVSLAFLSSSEFWLESLEVSLVLLDFNQPVGSLLSSILILAGHFGSSLILSKIFEREKLGFLRNAITFLLMLLNAGRAYAENGHFIFDY